MAPEHLPALSRPAWCAVCHLAKKTNKQTNKIKIKRWSNTKQCNRHATVAIGSVRRSIRHTNYRLPSFTGFFGVKWMSLSLIGVYRETYFSFLISEVAKKTRVSMLIGYSWSMGDQSALITVKKKPKTQRKWNKQKNTGVCIASTFHSNDSFLFLFFFIVAAAETKDAFSEKKNEHCCVRFCSFFFKLMTRWKRIRHRRHRRYRRVEGLWKKNGLEMGSKSSNFATKPPMEFSGTSATANRKTVVR